LKSSFDSRTNDDAHEAVKNLVICVFCLSWKTSGIGGAGDTEPPTCFVLNSPLCMICEIMDLICEETMGIKEYLCVLLQTVKDL